MNPCLNMLQHQGRAKQWQVCPCPFLYPWWWPLFFFFCLFILHELWPRFGSFLLSMNVCPSCSCNQSRIRQVEWASLSRAYRALFFSIRSIDPNSHFHVESALIFFNFGQFSNSLSKGSHLHYRHIPLSSSSLIVCVSVCSILYLGNLQVRDVGSCRHFVRTHKMKKIF